MSTSSRARGVIVSAAAVGALILGAVGLAPTASAALIGATTGTVASGNGLVGVPQTVSLTATEGGVLGTIDFSLTATNSNGGQVVTIQTFNNVANPFAGQAVWIPPHVGMWTFAIDGNTAGQTLINPVGTTVSVSAPNTVKAGVPVTISANVTPANGSQLSPLGSVQFSIVGGANIGSPQWLSGGNPSSASVQWTPAVLGTTNIVATYTPYVNNGFADTSCGSNCTSAADAVQVTASGSSFFLSNPPTMNAGTPVTLQAVVGVSPPSGTVTFFINGAPIANNVPVPSNGVVQAQWNPPAPGTYTLSANWIANNGVTGSSSEPLTVGSAAATPDTITITPAGGTPWTANGSYTLPGGTTTTLSVTTASGAAATLSEAGPCTLAGNALSTPAGNASCRVTATSPGGNGYGPATAVFTVNSGIGQQIAILAAPNSGRIKVGTVLTMETPQQGDTNAGQNITWKITSGKAKCKLGFPNSGAVTLKIKKKGYCTAIGTAPGVPGQWAPYNVSRTYQGF